MAKVKGRYKQNVVKKRWAILCRNEYGEEWVEEVKSESEHGAVSQIPLGTEVIGIEEYGK